MFKPNRSISLLDRLSTSSADSRRLPPNLLESIVSGEKTYDFEFDQALPPRLRALADIHWSPIEVARTIAFALKDCPRARFIDIGAGPGKLCLLLALMTDWEIYGIEQREDLVTVARQICDENAPGRVHMIHGNMLTLDWDHFDIFYLYNPFQEHMCGRDGTVPIDRKIHMTRRFYAKYVDEVFRQLVLLKAKQRVITFHGYGGRLPTSLKLLKSWQIEKGTLSIFEKV